jgi:hypothetical protein
MASLADYPNTLALATLVSEKLDARGNDIPARLDLGWIHVESAGGQDIRDVRVASLGGELGLGQLSAEERARVGYTDTDLLTSKTPDGYAYQLDALHALIDAYGGTVGSLGVDPSDNAYWRLVKLAHGGGEPFMKVLVKGYTHATGQPPTDSAWGDFETWALANPVKSFNYTQHWLNNSDDVWSHGLALATLAHLVPPGLGDAGSIGGWIPVVAALGLLGAALYAVKG